MFDNSDQVVGQTGITSPFGGPPPGMPVGGPPQGMPAGGPPVGGPPAGGPPPGFDSQAPGNDPITGALNLPAFSQAFGKMAGPREHDGGAFGRLDAGYDKLVLVHRISVISPLKSFSTPLWQRMWQV